MGAALARHRALRGIERLRARQSQTGNLALSGLRDLGDQRGQTLRSVVIEQIAGDEIETTDAGLPDRNRIPPAHAMGRRTADRKQHVYDVLADNVLVTGEAFMGTSLGCARCHESQGRSFFPEGLLLNHGLFSRSDSVCDAGNDPSVATAGELAEFERGREARVKKEVEKLKTMEAEMIAFLKKEDKLGNPNEKRKARVQTFIDDARGTPATWSYINTRTAPGWKEVGIKSFQKLDQRTGRIRNEGNSQFARDHRVENARNLDAGELWSEGIAGAPRARYLS